MSLLDKSALDLLQQEFRRQQDAALRKIRQDSDARLAAADPEIGGDGSFQVAFADPQKGAAGAKGSGGPVSAGGKVARAAINGMPGDKRQNLEDNIKGLFGDQFTPAELEAIKNTVLDHVRSLQVMDFVVHPMGQNDYPNAPLTPEQIKRFDGLVANMPDDPLSKRAKDAYADAKKPGGKLVKP